MEGQKLNIPSYVQDTNYRYQMPVMKLKIEGRGKNIRTNIENMVDISKALNVNTEYPLKFIGIELGSRIIYEKNGNDITTSLKGVFQYDDIQKPLDKFIEKYVLCPKCRLPEMHLRIRGKGKAQEVHGKCESCGDRSKLDNEHKMANYMTDPKNKPLDWGIESKRKKGEANTSESTEQRFVVDDKPGTKASKPKKAPQDRQYNKEDLALGGQLLTQQIEAVHEICKEHLSDNSYKQFKDVELAKKELIQELYSIATENGLEDRLFFALFQGLFSINVAHEIQRNKPVLTEAAARLKLVLSRECLLNLEYLTFVAHQQDKFLSAIPTLLKKFSDEELLDEEFLSAWSDKSDNLKAHFLYDEQRDTQFKAAATPFLDWIKQPAEDDDEGEEEEGEQQSQQKDEEEKKEEPLNIDDI